MTDKYENPTSDDYMGVVMGIIMSGGNAKGLAFQAIQQAKAGEFAEAESSLNEASEQLREAHDVQTEPFDTFSSRRKNWLESLHGSCSRPLNECDYL